MRKTMKAVSLVLITGVLVVVSIRLLYVPFKPAMLTYQSQTILIPEMVPYKTDDFIVALTRQLNEDSVSWFRWDNTIFVERKVMRELELAAKYTATAIYMARQQDKNFAPEYPQFEVNAESLDAPDDGEMLEMLRIRRLKESYESATTNTDLNK